MSYGNGMRRRVLKGYDEGKKTRALARDLRVSESYCRRVKQRRDQPLLQVGGGHLKLDKAACVAVSRFVNERPDATLEELRARVLKELSIQVSIGALWATLRRMKLSLKKSR